MKPSLYKGWYWGHPEAEPIDSREYVKEKEEVSVLAKMNHENPAIVRAVRSIDKWIEEAYKSRYYLYKHLLGRLWDIGIRGTDIMVETSAITLYRIRNPNRFLSDKHYIHVVGNKIARIVPYWGETKGYEHNGIGMDVRKHLGGVEISICKAVIQSQKNARKIKQDMSVPLEF